MLTQDIEGKMKDLEDLVLEAKLLIDKIYKKVKTTPKLTMRYDIPPYKEPKC